MKKKFVIISIIIGVVLTAISFLLLYSQESFLEMKSSSIGKAIIPHFTELNIQKIKIVKPNGKTITLQKNNNDWVITNCFDYPADPQKINSFLQELSSMKIIQNVHTYKVALSTLDLLSPEKSKANAGTQVILLGNNNKTLFSFIVGTLRLDNFGNTQISRGRYIRKTLTSDVFLVEETLNEINYLPRSWLNTKFATMENIKSIQLMKESKEIWSIIKPTLNSKFISADNTLYDPNKIEKLVETLESLRFETIADPSHTKTYTGLDNPYIIKVSTFNGNSWSIYVGSKNKNCRYVKIEQTTGNSKDETNSFLEKWIYLVNQNKLEVLLQTRNDLLIKGKKSPESIENKIYSNPIS